MSSEETNLRVVVHLLDVDDTEHLLSAIEITDLMGWKDILITDTAGHMQPLSSDEQTRLVKEATRRAAGSKVLFNPVLSPGLSGVVGGPILYACPNDAMHPKHIAFDGDPVPVCLICRPPVTCHTWQPSKKKG